MFQKLNDFIVIKLFIQSINIILQFFRIWKFGKPQILTLFGRILIFYKMPPFLSKLSVWLHFSFVWENESYTFIAVMFQQLQITSLFTFHPYFDKNSIFFTDFFGVTGVQTPPAGVKGSKEFFFDILCYRLSENIYLLIDCRRIIFTVFV